MLTGSIVKDQAPEDDALPSYFHLQLPEKLGIDAAGTAGAERIRGPRLVNQGTTTVTVHPAGTNVDEALW